jgi:hypothetical protein
MINRELDRIRKDMKGSSHGLIEGTVLASAWRNCGKPQKTSVGIVSLQDLGSTVHETGV